MPLILVLWVIMIGRPVQPYISMLLNELWDLMPRDSEVNESCLLMQMHLQPDMN